MSELGDSYDKWKLDYPSHWDAEYMECTFCRNNFPIDELRCGSYDCYYCEECEEEYKDME